VLILEVWYPKGEREPLFLARLTHVTVGAFVGGA